MTKENFLWFGLPVLTFFGLVIAEAVIPEKNYVPFVEENGQLEIVQFIILCVAVFFAAICFRSAKAQNRKFLMLWFGTAILGCIYCAGEEISWGQQFLKWTTPEAWKEINDQQETNLHNTSSWLDQKPRILLEIGVIIGGILLPLLRRMRPSLIPGRLAEIIPSGKAALTAAIFLVIKIIDKIDHITNFILFSRGSEITELFVYYFLLLYLWSFAVHKLKNSNKNSVLI